MSRDNVRDLEEELSGVARELAKALISPAVDQARVDELDRRASALRSRIAELRPAPPAEPYTLGGYLLCGG